MSDTKDLSEFVSTHAAEFNRVNVTTVFHQVLGNPSQITGAGIAGTEGVCSAKHARFFSPINCQYPAHYGESEVQSDRSSSVGAGVGIG